MVHSKDQKIKIEISADALILCAVLLLLLPIQWLGAAILAAIFHELCHVLATFMLGGNIESVVIGGRGTIMKATTPSLIRGMIASLAGPVGSFALLLLAKWMPRTAICGLVHGIYNLLPLFPLDGGQIFRSILFSILTPPKANKLFAISQHFFLLCICILFCVGIGRFSFILFAVFVAIIWLRRRQIPLAK